MNAKQEILDALTEVVDYDLGTFYTSRIRAILETHTLEPIDERPFDPTLCGWEAVGSNTWSNKGSIDICKFHDRMAIENFEGNLWNAPWPATQSEGERLLKLLGVLK